MSTTTHHNSDSAREPRDASRHVEPASAAYDAQVDALLVRIRDENTFASQMIRSILGPTQSRRIRR